jgi:hypothetical protein
MGIAAASCASIVLAISAGARARMLRTLEVRGRPPTSRDPIEMATSSRSLHRNSVRAETLPIARGSDSCAIRGEATVLADRGRSLDVEAGVFEVEVALDEVHDFIVDPSLASELDHSVAFRVKELAA